MDSVLVCMTKPDGPQVNRGPRSVVVDVVDVVDVVEVVVVVGGWVVLVVVGGRVVDVVVVGG